MKRNERVTHTLLNVASSPAQDGSAERRNFMPVGVWKHCADIVSKLLQNSWTTCRCSTCNLKVFVSMVSIPEFSRSMGLRRPAMACMLWKVDISLSASLIEILAEFSERLFM